MGFRVGQCLGSGQELALGGVQRSSRARSSNEGRLCVVQGLADRHDQLPPGGARWVDLGQTLRGQHVADRLGHVLDGCAQLVGLRHRDRRRLGNYRLQLLERR